MEEREVKEIFNVEKDGKEKTVVTKGKEKEVEVKKDQEKKQSKLLSIILFTLGFILLGTIFLYLYSDSVDKFEYRGLDFQRIRENQITFYHTSFLIYEGKKEITYNVYLRKNPKVLDQVPFENEKLKLNEILVLNMTGDFKCDGYGVIAVANMVNILKGIGVETINDPEATCDLEERYSYMNIQEGNETKIVQYGPACYEVYVSNCEILEATEKFLLEVLVKKNS